MFGKNSLRPTSQEDQLAQDFRAGMDYAMQESDAISARMTYGDDAFAAGIAEFNRINNTDVAVPEKPASPTGPDVSQTPTRTGVSKRRLAVGGVFLVAIGAVGGQAVEADIAALTSISTVTDVAPAADKAAAPDENDFCAVPQPNQGLVKTSPDGRMVITESQQRVVVNTDDRDIVVPHGVTIRDLTVCGIAVKLVINGSVDTAQLGGVNPYMLVNGDVCQADVFGPGNELYEGENSRINGASSLGPHGQGIRGFSNQDFDSKNVCRPK